MYTFPSSVNYPDASLNDFRFDLRENATESGQGIVYLSDESAEGRNGIVVLDLGTGESWRHLDLHPSTRGTYGVVPSYQGRHSTNGQQDLHIVISHKVVMAYNLIPLAQSCISRP